MIPVPRPGSNLSCSVPEKGDLSGMSCNDSVRVACEYNLHLFSGPCSDRKKKEETTTRLMTIPVREPSFPGNVSVMWFFRFYSRKKWSHLGMPGPFVYTCMKLREEVYFMALSFQFYDFTAHISYHCPGDNILC